MQFENMREVSELKLGTQELEKKMEVIGCKKIVWKVGKDQNDPWFLLFTQTPGRRNVVALKNQTEEEGEPASY